MTRASSGSSRRVLTSGGEEEVERRSRSANLVEACVVYGAVQAVLWSGVGQPGALAGGAAWPVAGAIVATAALVWVLAMAPSLHGDTWHDMGLPRPWELIDVWRREGPAWRAAAAAIVAAGVVSIAAATWRPLLIRTGVRQASREAFLRLTDSPWLQVGSAVTAAVAGLALAAVLVRWSNLRSASRALARPLMVFIATALGLAMVVAALSGDWRPVTSASWSGTGRSAFFPTLAAYLPWAFLQQWFFGAYLNTRLRRSIAPNGGRNTGSRAVVAVLTGAAFGLLHLPNLPLVVLTGTGGLIAGWFLQQDRSRNLFLLALGHALAGTILVTLTSMQMVVGPRL